MADETVQVGKYTLESLTTGMYSDPKIVYREYIQNSPTILQLSGYLEMQYGKHLIGILYNFEHGLTEKSQHAYFLYLVMRNLFMILH